MTKQPKDRDEQNNEPVTELDEILGRIFCLPNDHRDIQLAVNWIKEVGYTRKHPDSGLRPLDEDKVYHFIDLFLAGLIDSDRTVVHHDRIKKLLPSERRLLAEQFCQTFGQSQVLSEEKLKELASELYWDSKYPDIDLQGIPDERYFIKLARAILRLLNGEK